MEQYNALSVINEFPETKKDIENYIRIAKDEILSGYYNPLQIEVKLKAMEEIISGLRKDEAIREMVIEEAEKYPDKTVTVFGCEIQKRNNSTYNYKYCNDSELEKLQSEYDEANKKLKARQDLLKLVKPGQLVNPETGELIEPPLISTKTVLAFKIL